MHFASLWPLSACIAVLTILQFIECDAGAMYAMPSSDSVPEASGLPSSAVGAAATHQSDSLDSAGSQSSSFARNMPFLPVNHFYYTRALRNAFGKLLAVHSDEMAARDGDPAAIVDSLLTSDDDPAGDAQSVQPFTRPTVCYCIKDKYVLIHSVACNYVWLYSHSSALNECTALIYNHIKHSKILLSDLHPFRTKCSADLLLNNCIRINIVLGAFGT